jgi:hypothetical protein
MAYHAINTILIYGRKISTGNDRIMQQSGLLAFGCRLRKQQMGRFAYSAEINSVPKKLKPI